MRNLKKVLSLALAMVMLLGMMVVGAGATSFTDDADITHQEAVTVVSGMEILTGVGDNTFNPKGTLSRAEAAVVIAKLDLGAAFGNLATTNASTFKDVGAGYGWAKPYIDYCAARGLIQGDGNGYFMPADKVTGVQFALMVCRVLGYEDDNESIGGADWEVNAAALARKAGLTIDVELGSNPIPRDDMAQVAFNALTADMVEYKQSAITIGNITIPAGKASPVENNGGSAVDYDKTDATNDGILQLCEQKFPKLEKTGNDDAFGRPATQWKYDKKEVIEIADDADATYTESVKYSDIYKDLGLSGGNKTATLIVDGNEDRNSDSNPDTITLTRTASTYLGGNGTLVQAYVDSDDAVTVVVINTYLAQVNGDYDKDDEELDIAMISSGANVTALGSLATTLSLDDLDNLANFEDDDYVLITAVTNGTNATVKSIAHAEVVTATVTSYQRKDAGSLNLDTVTFDGSAKKYSANFDANGQSTTYAINEDSVFIMDAYGYVIGLDEVAGSDDYVFVKEFSSQGNFSGNYIADAYFPDGTHETISLDKINGNKITGTATNGDPTQTTVTAGSATYSGWYTYTVKDNKYSLTKVDALTDAVWEDVDQGKTVTENGKVAVVYQDEDIARATNSTVLVVKDGSKITTYTGIKNFPTIKTESHDGTWSWVAIDNGYVKYMFVDVGDASIKGVNSSSTDQIFILGTDYKTVQDSNDNTYYTYDAIVNGEKTTVNANDAGIFSAIGLYDDIAYDEDGYVDSAQVAADGDDDHDVKAITAKAVKHNGDVVTIDTNVLVLADDCMIRVIDGSNGKTVTSINNGKALADKYKDKAITGTIYVVFDDNDYVTALYVKVTGTDAVAAATNAKLEATLSYTGTLAWESGDTVKFTSDGGTKLNHTFTYDGSDWTTSDAAPGSYDAPTFDGSVLTVTASSAGTVAASPFGDITVEAKKGGTTTISNVVATPGAWDDGSSGDNKAELTATVTGPVTPTWADTNTVAITSAGSSTNLSLTFTYSGATHAWTTSDTVTGYTPTFDGSKLTLEATTGRKVNTSPFGNLTVVVTNTNSDTATVNNAGAGTWTTGSDAVG